MENYVNQPNLTGLTSRQALSANQSAPMQGIDAQALQSQVKDNYVSSRASQLAEINPLVQMGVSIPVWYGICQSMDAFNRKCRGKYEDSIEYKITNAGDRLSNSFTNSTLGKSKFMQWANGKIAGLKKYYRQKVYTRSSVLKAMAETPAVPELKFVQGQMSGIVGMQCNDYSQPMKAFLEHVRCPEDLDCYGADKKFIDKVKAVYGRAAGKEAKANIIRDAEFQLFSRNSKYADSTVKTLSDFKNLNEVAKESLLKDMKAKASGWANLKEWEIVEKNANENAPKIIEALSKSDKNMYARIWSHNGTIGAIQGHLFGRKVYPSEQLNKLLAELSTKAKTDVNIREALTKAGLNGKLPKTALGRAFGKYSNILLEASSNRISGGKIAALLQAYFLAETVIRTVQADRGDKLPTFMDNFVNLVAMMACMPFAVQLMYKICGLENIGMDKAKLATYRKALKAFNEKVKNGKLVNKALYNTERTALQKMMKDSYKGVKKNLFTRIAHKIGQVMTIGSSQIRPYTKHAVKQGTNIFSKIANGAKDFFRNPKYWSKEVGGSAIRFWISMGVILPFFIKIAVKGTNFVFGKPKHSTLDKEPDEKAASTTTPDKEAELKQLQEALREQQIKQQQSQNAIPQAQTADSNLLDKYKTRDTGRYMPSPEPVKSADEPVRTYMPSPMPAPVTVDSNQDASKADAVLANADKAEQMVKQTLNIQ